MSRTIYDILREMHETGWTLNDLLIALDTELEQMSLLNRVRQSQGGRYVSLSRTNLEVSLMQAEKYKQKTGEGIPLVFIEDEE